jgi:DNA-binding PadR family transcriptional regulator
MSVNGASVYQTLERLLRLGLIQIQETARTQGHPDRIVYAITKQGRDMAASWLREMLANIGSDFPEFPAAVSMLTPEDARKQFEIRTEAVRKGLSKLDSEKWKEDELPRRFLLENAYRAAVLEAELVLLQSVISDLATESPLSVPATVSRRKFL